MAKPKIGTDMFRQKAQSRKADQASIEKTIVTGEQASAGRGRPVKHTEPTVTMSIRISEDLKQALKMYATVHKTTISDLISEYARSLMEGDA